MKQLTTNVLMETGLKGANHGIDRYPMDVGPGRHGAARDAAERRQYDYLTSAEIHNRDD